MKKIQIQRILILKQNYKDVSFEHINYINVAERGPFIIQECTNIQNFDSDCFYVLWDKNKREHLRENDTPITFLSKEGALNFIFQQNTPDKFEANIEIER